MNDSLSKFADLLNDMKVTADQADPLSVGKSKTGNLLIRRGKKIVLIATDKEARSIANHIRDLFGDGQP